jgi:hypothetical protein
MARLSWKQRRKLLPKNYVQHVQNALKNDCIELSTSQITDIIRGKWKNPEYSVLVWGYIRALEKKFLKLHNQANRLKQGKLPR